MRTSVIDGLPLTAPQNASQPLAFNFFNPTTDLQKEELSSPSPVNFGWFERVQGNSRAIPPPHDVNFVSRGSFLPPPAFTFGATPSSSRSRSYSGPVGTHTYGRSPTLQPHEHVRSSGMCGWDNVAFC